MKRRWNRDTNGTCTDTTTEQMILLGQGRPRPVFPSSFLYSFCACLGGPEYSTITSMYGPFKQKLLSLYRINVTVFPKKIQKTATEKIKPGIPGIIS